MNLPFLKIMKLFVNGNKKSGVMAVAKMMKKNAGWKHTRSIKQFPGILILMKKSTRTDFIITLRNALLMHLHEGKDVWMCCLLSVI